MGTKPRVKMTEREYQEIIEARAWCQKKGGSGFGNFYDDLLEFHHGRGTLPELRLPPVPGRDGGEDR